MKYSQFIKSCFYLSTIALLTSCVAVVVVGAAAGLVYDRRSVTTLEADARLYHRINKAIVTSHQLRGARILVTSFNRNILLVGQAPLASQRIAAEKTAQETPGVGRVYDEVVVSYPIALTQRSKDSWITSQVRSNMLTKKGLESGSIRIVTEQGVVFLMGIVTAEQASLAVDVARRVKGVNKVVKIFQYIH
jgi:osmotically-inducible protein OsmY